MRKKDIKNQENRKFKGNKNIKNKVKNQNIIKKYKI